MTFFTGLLREFEFVKKINNCIITGNEVELKKIIEYRRVSITDSQSEYNILTIRSNLLFFSIDLKGSTPWMQRKEYIDFFTYFLENYSAKVKDLTIDYLRQHGGSCDADDVEYYVMDKLKNEIAINEEKYKIFTFENKAMLNAIFRVYLLLNTTDPFELCWGTLSLRESRSNV